MTRSQFLKLLAASPAVHLGAQTPATGAAPKTTALFPGRAAPPSGSLLVAEGGPRPRVLVNGQGMIYGKRTPTMLTLDRRMAFFAFVAHPVEDDWQSYLTTLDFASGYATADYPYPGPVSSRGVSLAISPDGAWLYTLTGRERGGRQSSNQGGVHPEMAVLYTFDVANRRFLPQGAEAPFEFSEGLGMFPNSNFRNLLVGPFSTGAFDSVLIDDKGKGSWTPHDKRGKVMTTGAFQLVLSPDRNGFLTIMPSGDVYRMGDGVNQRLEAGRGGVDALAPDRLYGQAALSGDGRLLFLPSGPTRMTDAYRFHYLDRIAVYRWSDLQKLREMISQRPLRVIQANPDGSQLYASGANFNEIAVLDAESLWQEQSWQYPGVPVESFCVLP